MLHAERAALRYGVSQAEILLELGRRKAVGGQEDMIIDVALELAARNAAGPSMAGQSVAGAGGGGAGGAGPRVGGGVGRGPAVVGAKLGLTSGAKQGQMKVSEPLYGWLTGDMAIDVGQPLCCGRVIQPRCEPEVAFVLRDDLAGAHVTAAQVLAATAAVHPAIDVLDSRFAGYSFTLPDVIADNASGAGFVLGGQATDPAGIDLRLIGVVLEKNGELI